jgi:hypothetical protein
MTTLRQVVAIAACALYGVHETGLVVHADVALHVQEIPGALLALTHIPAESARWCSRR